jgi:hypothetical protein
MLTNKTATCVQVAIILCIIELTEYLYQQEAVFPLRNRGIWDSLRPGTCSKIFTIANRDQTCSKFFICSN